MEANMQQSGTLARVSFYVKCITSVGFQKKMLNLGLDPTFKFFQGRSSYE